MFKKSMIAAALALAALPVAAHHAGDQFRTGPMVVSHAWTEETSPMAHAAEVFLTVENTGEAVDRLLSATTSFTAPGVFQASVMTETGAVAVREVPAIEIAPGQSITFQPGGIHVVLNDVKRNLEAGDHFHMTLVFEEAGALEIDVEIEEHGDHDHDAPAG
ncbi:copper chaperone PCu(A)C [Salinarimonas ramus]|uniref:Copper chaperone PCu(A)C n=1 Tax=Salinarimonas ramus TaxID=690164 RepID=A0A917QJ54_9HYPH|nr:copper chaperone PCu(A)C [Salinarimonas ramus]GGK53372.1 hypothetical protein GCM10011322_45260 [Salinarimonas ramus]